MIKMLLININTLTYEAYFYALKNSTFLKKLKTTLYKIKKKVFHLINVFFYLLKLLNV